MSGNIASNFGLGCGSLGQAEDLEIAIKIAKECSIVVDKEFYMGVLKVVYGDYTDAIGQVLLFIETKMDQMKEEGGNKFDESKLYGCHCHTQEQK